MMAAASIPPAPSRPAPTLRRRGLMLVLASPPGGGKTTISRALVERDPDTTVSVSATTRGRRPGEREGEHYFFVSPEAFQEMVDEGQMLEHALVYNQSLYGTPRAPVEKALAAGRDVIFDVDWQGMRNLSQTTAGQDVVSVFLLPPSWEALEDRLHGRARDTEEEIARRLGKARDEIAHYREFQYVMVNNDLEESIAAVHAILRAERHRRARLTDVADFVETLKPGA